MTRGVLLLGDSGSGKSLFALSLLYDGGRLVSDDVVEVFRRGDGLFGRAPGSRKTDGKGGQSGKGGQLKETRGLLEIKGVGIVDIGRVLGPSFIIDESRVDLAVRLDGPKGISGADGGTGDVRGVLGINTGGLEILGVTLPELSFGGAVDPKGLVTAIADFILSGSQESAVLRELLGDHGRKKRH